MAKLKYQMPKGQRLKRVSFYKVTTPDRFWWCHATNKWVPYGSHLPKGGSSSFWDCYSVRAFKRRLRQWSSYLPKGTEFTLVSYYWDGYNVEGVTN